MDKEITEKTILKKLHASGQQHIINYLELMSPEEKEFLLNDLKKIDLNKISMLYQLYLSSKHTKQSKRVFQEAEVLCFHNGSNPSPGKRALYSLGEDYLKEGKVAIMLVAGGQGTRLGFKGPKGCYPVSPVMGKSLFQIFSETILALQNRYGRVLYWYIMTSADNHEETRAFFLQHDFFGLSPDQIFFFQQGVLPSLDLEGKLILNTEKKIYKNPNGHGGSLNALENSGALKHMRHRGIEEIFYFQVDNPLVKIADPLFIGAHVAYKAEMSTKVVRKVDPFEKVGIIGRIDGKLGCIEYSELSPEQMKEHKDDGSLKFNSANIAIHMLKRDFVEAINTNPAFSLPYHIAVKEITCLRAGDGSFVQTVIRGIKFEKFIFDALRYARSSITLEVKREEEFSPVKNREGVDSPLTAKQAIINMYKNWVKKSGKISSLPDDFIIEVSPLYALDEEEFKKKFTPHPSLQNPLYLAP